MQKTGKSSKNLSSRTLLPFLSRNSRNSGRDIPSSLCVRHVLFYVMAVSIATINVNGIDELHKRSKVS